MTSKHLYKMQEYRRLLEKFQPLNEHSCPDWDELEINVHDLEFESCNCSQYKETSYSPIREQLVKEYYNEP